MFSSARIKDFFGNLFDTTVNNDGLDILDILEAEMACKVALSTDAAPTNPANVVIVNGQPWPMMSAPNNSSAFSITSLSPLTAPGANETATCLQQTFTPPQTLPTLNGSSGGLDRSVALGNAFGAITILALPIIGFFCARKCIAATEAQREETLKRARSGGQAHVLGSNAERGDEYNDSSNNFNVHRTTGMGYSREPV